MNPIAIHLQARRELGAAARRYESEREGLGQAFLDAVQATIERAWQAPLTGVLIEGDVRRLLVRRFPYLVVYLIRDDGISVLAVSYERRRPGYWRKRIPR